MRCHILIGLPGSGKTTFAEQWCAHDPSLCHISTDRIRFHLYGHEIEQGDWNEIQREILMQATTAIANDHPIIYDATNVDRHHRFAILRDLRQLALDSVPDRLVHFHGWTLNTPFELCHWRNHHRNRVVPADVLQEMGAALSAFPPNCAEGFTSLQAPPNSSNDLAYPVWDFEAIVALVDRGETRQH